MRTHVRTILSLIGMLLLTLWAQGQTAVSTALPASDSKRANMAEGYDKLPLAFEANQGQSDPQVKFLSRGTGYSLFLSPGEATLALHKAITQESASPTTGTQLPKEEQSSVLRLKLVGASAKAEVAGQDELPGKSNYFVGNDPKKWHMNVRQYAKVRYTDLYPGVDLVYYGNQRELEYDFVLQPGANPTQIRMQIEGASRLRLERGDLVLTSVGGEVRLRQPHIYQEVNGVRRNVRGRYAIRGAKEVGFRVSGYDTTRALIIDPVLAYSTYLGGNLGDAAARIAVDAAGNAFVTGGTTSTDFPTANAIQPTYGGISDVFVTKINSEGTSLVYSTYLGGSGEDDPGGITVDAAGNAYVTGRTISSNFPTFNAFQPTKLGTNNAFVTKINAAGNALIYSTYLGGSGTFDVGTGIAADSSGNAYVTGVANSTDFPVVNAFQPTNHGGAGDIFVTKFNANGSALVYSTYLGGSDLDVGRSIAVDAAGNAYVTGNTWSTDFPTANAFQPTYHGGSDAFVAKISASGGTLDYSTYLGGSGYDGAEDVAFDTAGNVYLTGSTASSDFPAANAIQPTLRGSNDAFVTKFNNGGSALVYSTYLAGSAGAAGSGITADSAGNAFVTGSTSSNDFPVVNPILPNFFGGAFVTKITGSGNAIVFSTYLGGSSYGAAVAVDATGSVYVTGGTNSTKFLVTPLAFQQSLKKRKGFPPADAFITKIAFQTSASVSPAKIGFAKRAVGTSTKPQKVKLTNFGATTLSINRIYLGGANVGDFAQSNNCGTSLAAGASCTISVTFTPTAIGLRNAAVGISDSDPASPQTVALNGKGT